jgi:hypothetical protein
MSGLRYGVPGLVAVAVLTVAGWTDHLSAQSKDRSETLPCFVQADSYRATADGTRVSLALGVEGADPWILSLTFARTGASPDEVPVAWARITGDRGVHRRVHDLVLPPGDYQLAMDLRRGSTTSRGTSRLQVPDLSGSRLVASPVVLGESATTVGGEGGFQFGSTRIVPAIVNRFAQGERLHLAFRVFGWRPDAERKPDLTVEYVFYQRIGDHHRFFNKTKPQELNPKTLPQGFDGRSGVVTTGLALPLDAFPAGDFQVTIRVHDKRSRTSTEQRATFVVAPA